MALTNMDNDLTPMSEASTSFNYGNIRDNKNGGFRKFGSPNEGIKAQQNLLLTYQDKHGLSTVRGIINRWAPPSENNTGGYVEYMAKEMGVSPDAYIDLHDPETMGKFSYAQAKMEKGAKNIQVGRDVFTNVAATNNTTVQHATSVKKPKSLPNMDDQISELPNMDEHLTDVPTVKSVKEDALGKPAIAAAPNQTTPSNPTEITPATALPWGQEGNVGGLRAVKQGYNDTFKPAAEKLVGTPGYEGKNVDEIADTLRQRDMAKNTAIGLTSVATAPLTATGLTGAIAFGAIQGGLPTFVGQTVDTATSGSNKYDLVELTKNTAIGGTLGGGTQLVSNVIRAGSPYARKLITEAQETYDKAVNNFTKADLKATIEAKHYQNLKNTGTFEGDAGDIVEKHYAGDVEKANRARDAAARKIPESSPSIISDENKGRFIPKDLSKVKPEYSGMPKSNYWTSKAGSYAEKVIPFTSTARKIQEQGFTEVAKDVGSSMLKEGIKGSSFIAPIAKTVAVPVVKTATVPAAAKQFIDRSHLMDIERAINNKKYTADELRDYIAGVLRNIPSASVYSSQE